MPAKPRFCIGIDLGTTNCALSYLPAEALEGNAPPVSRVFPVAQWETASTVVDSSTMPSFLWLPTDAESASIHGRGEATIKGEGEWIVGRLARHQAGVTPERVVNSAKSWLCHHAVDRTSAFLPWGSEEIPTAKKISPLRASALLLSYLRNAWDARMAAGDPGARFDQQEIVITVPASFDAFAQKLTLEAAQAAGFPPERTRLIEEPQAAFYRWLEAHPPGTDWRAILPGLAERSQRVIVIDIGGGTSDFSLFEMTLPPGGVMPGIKRLAVSDHILLGGDNIDLALAHKLEPQIAGGADQKLTSTQWHYLVARCRELKERALAAESGLLSSAPVGGEKVDMQEAFSVAIPGRGSGLLAGTRTARITRAELRALLVDGFFPWVDVHQRPSKSRSALREFGLPYAQDSAVTKHLAVFLRERLPVDAVLFNGGTLHPRLLQERLRDQLGKWQQNRTPVLLENPEPDVAVARGAARYAWLRQFPGAGIEAGAARSVYVEVRMPGSAPSAVCLLPQNTPTDEDITLDKLEMKLRVNQPVRFQVYTSAQRPRDKVGSVVPLDDERLAGLPPLQTVAKVEARKGLASSDDIPVHLRSRLNAIGLLQIVCVAANSKTQPPPTWQLDFPLNTTIGSEAVAAARGASPEMNAGVEPEKLAEVSRRLERMLREPAKEKLTANRVYQMLQTQLGKPKQEWNGVLLRALWPSFVATFDARKTSVEHEEAWLALAGYFMRPGYGADLDEARIDELWRLFEKGLAFPNRDQVKVQEWILWRRVAGGLDRTRQESLRARWWAQAQTKKGQSAELVRLLGSLERLELEHKRALVALLLPETAALAAKAGHAEPYLVALTRLLNRAPLYVGPELVLPPELVEETFTALRPADWTSPALREPITTLFLRAARIVNNRALDLPSNVRGKVLDKLEDAKIPVERLFPLRDYVPLVQGDKVSLFGESLPAGLSLDG